MQTINRHEAKTQLAATNGESFITAEAGKPLVKVTPIDAVAPSRHLGFAVGQMQIPEDFDRMGETEIAQMFDRAE